MSEHRLTKGGSTLVVDDNGAWVTRLCDTKGDILFPRESLQIAGRQTKFRGGCHVCVPQFGPARGELDLPQHGFGRDSLWLLQDKTDSTLVFHLAPTHEDYIDLQIILRYELQENALRSELSLHNDGAREMRVAPGFHPYFAIGDAVTIGLDDETVQVDAYHEMATAHGFEKKLEVKGRQIVVSSEELNVWALWSDRLGDYFCVEPTLGGNRFLIDNPDEDETLAPNAHASYTMTISW